MEPRFGRDFSGVRVHADSKASGSAQAVNALAYTVGRDVVFGAGEYQPHTHSGRKLLGHELAHVAQQSGGNPASPDQLRIGPVNDPYEQEAESAAGHVVGDHSKAAPGPVRRLPPSTGGVLRRVPGKDAADSWKQLVGQVQIENISGEKKATASTVLDRFLKIPSGQKLINDLWKTFCGRKGRCRSKITVHVVDKLPPEAGGEAAGYFTPSAPDQPLYDVYLLYHAPLTEDERSRTLPAGQWPQGKSNSQIFYKFVDSESEMAITLFHELLHVWFVNQGGSPLYPTGHGDVEKGEFEPDYFEKLKQAYAEIDALEAKIRSEVEAGKNSAPKAPTALPADVPEPSAAPRRPPAPTSRPLILGGELSLQIGGAGGNALGKGALSSLVGADVVLGKINSLHLGARGLYLTPNHLLAGGAIGFRFREGERTEIGSRPVENPLFFDLEAGVLAEIPTQQAERISNNVVGMGSVGIGQEYGREGTRFFWKVGAFVLVSDRKEVSGGGSAGVGVEF
jgi:hypothetical protein